MSVSNTRSPGEMVSAPDTPPTAIATRRLTKRYGATVAVDAVSLDFARGMIHALVGANGAGKSTLGKMIAGVIRPDDGELYVDDRTVHYSSPREALNDGVALIAQELAVAPHMSVQDNVLLGVEPRRAGFIRRARMRREVSDLLERSGFELPLDAPVGSLSLANQQKAEILRAVARGARTIVMDEPTSSLTPDEIHSLHRLIRDLLAAGLTFIYVSHFLKQVLAVADTVTVLRNGSVVSTSAACDETEDSLVAAMLGHSLEADYPDKHVHDRPEPVLEVTDMSTATGVSDVSFTLHRGEILGIAGLVGSGRTELLRAVFGADAADRGEIRIDGEPLSRPSPKRAIAAGIALVPEDRKKEGLMLERSAADNTTLGHLRSRRISRLGWVRTRAQRRETARLLTSLHIKPAAPTAIVKTMSGGNQQKVLVSRCLFGTPKVLLLDEPTRGVDVGARRALHDLIADLAEDGVAVLMVSSEIEELLGLCHRMLVMREGRVVADLPGDAPLDQVMQAAFGRDTAGLIGE